MVRNAWRHWLPRLVSKPAPRNNAKARRQLAGYRPRFDRLEDRTVPAVNITATNTDMVVIGGPQADPGDTIEYTVVVTNTGTTDATSVQFADLLDPATMLVNGTINVSPLAFNDSYDAVGNTLLKVGNVSGSGPAVSVAGSVVTNDVEFLGDTFIISAFDATSTGGGTVSMITTGADRGSFSYLPAVGFTGMDTFTYTLRDDGIDGIQGNADDLTGVGTVTITVANTVWYVDNGAGTTGDGRSTSPFDSLADVSGAAGLDAVGDIIFVHTGSGNYTGGITLLNNQTLWGQNETLLVGGFTLLAAGTDPVLTNTGVGNNGVTLASGNTLKGFTVGDTGRFDIVNTAATSVGAMTISNVILNGTGGLIEASSGGALNVTIDTGSTTSSGPEAVNLQSTTGTFTISGGAISGVSSTAVRIGGGTVAVSIASSIALTTGSLVSINNHATNNITFSGALSATGSAGGIAASNNTSGTIAFTNASKVLNTGGSTAVNLTNNTGATINFTGGGLDIDTTSGGGFNATGGGTVTVQGSGNTISSTTGTALNIANTNIGANDVTFLSISANGAVNGIVLNNTGTSVSNGGLIVTGDGGTTANGSGGTIQNSTGAGISLNSTRDVSLDQMNVTNGGDDGIHGVGVVNFTLNRSNVNNNGNSTSDDGLQFGESSGTVVGVTGNVSILDSSISANAHNNVHFRNTSGNISVLTVTGNTFSNVNDTTGANSFLFEASGTSTVTSANLSGNTFGNNAPQRSLEVQAHDSATISSFTVDANTFTDSGIHVSFTQDTSSNLDFNLTDNMMTGANPLQAVNVFSSSTATGGTITGEISGNTIGNAAVAGSGSTAGPGIRVLIQGQTDSTLLIDNNTIRQVGFTSGSRGMDLQFLGSTTTGLGVTSLNDITITNNFVQTDAPGSTFPLAAIFLSADNQGSPARVRADIRNNTVPASGSFDYPTFDGNGGQLVFVNVTAGAVAQLVDNAPASATPLAELQSHNTGLMYADASPLITLIAGPIGLPPLLAAPGGVAASEPGGSANATESSGADTASPQRTEAGVPSAGNTVGTSTTPQSRAPETAIVDDGVLTQAELDFFVTAAIDRWTATDLTAEQLAFIESVTFDVADMSGWYLGAATPGHITIDTNAAGFGWFLDATPLDDSEFPNLWTPTRMWTTPGADASDSPAGKMDLLTTVMHELGHQLGLPDYYVVDQRNNLMYGYLVMGERRLPGDGQVDGYTPGSVEYEAFLFSPIAIGTLPAGKSVTIKFQVTIVNPVPAGTSQVSNQGTVSGSNFSDVLTDDPDIVGATNPTVTTVVADPVVAATKVDALVIDNGTPGVADPGDTIEYTVVVSNTGNEGAGAVLFSDTPGSNTTLVVGSVTTTAGTITSGNTAGNTTVGVNLAEIVGAGGTATITFRVQINSAVTSNTTEVTNQGSFAGSNFTTVLTDDPDVGGASDPTATPIVADPNVAVTKVDALQADNDSSGNVSPGDRLRYTIVISNSGNEGGGAVLFSDSPGTNTILVVGSVTTTGGTITSGNVAGDTSVGVNVGELPGAGGSITITFDVLIVTPVPAGVGQVSNQGSVSGNNFTTLVTDDPDAGGTADPTTTVVFADPVVAASKVDVLFTDGDGDGQADPGDVIQYTVVVTNSGNENGSTVLFSDMPGTNTSLVVGSVTTTQGTINTGNTAGDTSVSVSLGGINGGGASATVIFRVTISAALPGNVFSVANQGSVSGGNFSNVLTDDPAVGGTADPTVTPVPTADLSITKSDSPDPVTPGGTLTYTIVVSNSGPDGVTGATVGDTFPAELTSLTLVSVTPAGGASSSLSPGPLAGSLSDTANLPNGSSITYVVTGGVSQSAAGTTLSNTATVSSTTRDPVTANNSDTEPTLVSGVDLTISKDDGQTTATPGQTITYVLTYQNAGFTDADNVVITETVPAGSVSHADNLTTGWVDAGGGQFTFDAGTLTAGGMAQTVQFKVTVLSPAPAGVNDIVNTATIADDGANGPDINTDDNTDTDTNMLDAAPDLQVSKGNGESTAQVNDTLTYTINYANVGNQDATGVKLTETLPTGTTFSAAGSTAGWTETAPGSGVFVLTIGNLGAGDSSTATFVVTVNSPAPAGLNSIANSVTISDDEANGGDPTPTDNTDTDDDTLNATPDLQVSKDDGVTTVQPGDTLTYTINYANVGDQDATGVVLTETLPAGTTFVAAGSSAWVDQGGGTFTLTIGSLAGAGGSGSATFIVTVNSPAAAGLDDIFNSVSIDDDGNNGADPTPGDNSVTDTDTLNAAPDLQISKDDEATTVQPGDTLTYTISYANVGNQDATGVVLTETLPAGTTFDSGASTAGWTETAPGSGVFTLAIGNLAGGGGGGFAAFVVSVTNPAAAGQTQIINSASIADDAGNGADPNTADNSDTDTDTLDAVPDLQVSKDDGVTTVTPGTTLTYTISYANVGNQEATGVVLTETLPAGTTFVAAGSDAWVDQGGGVFTLTIGNLAGGGASGSAIFKVLVDNPATAGRVSIDNAVSIADDAANGVDPNTADNSDTDGNTLIAAPDLQLVKSDGGASVRPGRTVSYTLTYTNVGDQDATGVFLTDVLPVHTTFNAAESTPGWTETAPGSGVFTLAIGNLAGGGGTGSAIFAVTVDSPLLAGVQEINNTATVDDDGANGPDPTPADNTDSDTTEVTRSIIAIGTDKGQTGQVFVFEPDSDTPKFILTPYGQNFQGGVRVAVGDVTGDGNPDIITAAGSGTGKKVFVFDGETGILVPGKRGSIRPFGSGYQGGVFVAAGDLNGDGMADIVVGSQPEGNEGDPKVKEFDGLTGAKILSFTAHGSGGTGVRVAVGNVAGSSRPEIITAPGSGAAPHVRFFDSSTGQPLPNSTLAPFGNNYHGGVHIAAADLDGDGLAEIITSTRAGDNSSSTASRVRIFSGADQSQLATITPYANYTGDLRVALVDVNGDGIADILTAGGPKKNLPIEAFDGVTRDALDVLFGSYDGAFLGGSSV